MAHPSALIGHTGFVGGNILRQHAFDELYNSRNIETIAGRRLDLLVISGAPAEKWKANADPDGDRAALRRLTEPLESVAAERVVLISTADVYPGPQGVDEDTPIDAASAQPYGRHRYELEEFVASRFPTLVVRLPGLYGEGLKKNVIYDFIHGNQEEKIHADGVFQFYGLERVWADVETAAAAGLSLVNLVTEPVSVAEVARAAFGREFTNRPTATAPRYDIRSKHAALFGGRDGYLRDKAAVLRGITEFVRRQRAALSPSAA